MAADLAWVFNDFALRAYDRGATTATGYYICQRRADRRIAFLYRAVCEDFSVTAVRGAKDAGDRASGDDAQSTEGRAARSEQAPQLPADDCDNPDHKRDTSAEFSGAFSLDVVEQLDFVAAIFRLSVR